jgi:hypothetical protein
MRYEAASYGAITPTLRFFARTFADAAEASGVAWRIGQMVNARDRIRRSYCFPTAAKFPSFVLITLTFMRDLQVKKRADERTRTADLESLYEYAARHLGATERPY